jgi:FkbM family methyltransferase
MKKFLKLIFKKLNLLEKIQYNPLYRINRSKEFKNDFRKQLLFYKKLLSDRNRLIFDIGANVGDYTYIFSKLANKVIAFEPDEKNNRILRTRFGGNKGIGIVQKAVSSTVGEADFFMQTPGSGYNTLSKKWVDILESEKFSRFDDVKKFEQTEKVSTTTLDDIIQAYGLPDFVKIDVEGFELDVLKGLTQPLPYFSFECNFPEFFSETIAGIEYLKNINPVYKFNYTREHEFLLPEYVSADEMIAILKSTDKRFFEIYCKAI